MENDMGDTVRLLESTLRARADQVTEESLRLPPDPPRPDAKPAWPMLAAAAAVLAVAAGVAVVVANVGPGDQAPLGPGPSTTSQATSPPTSSETIPQCAGDGGECLIQTVDTAGGELRLFGVEAPEAGDGFYQDWILRTADDVEVGRGGVADSSTEPGNAPGLTGHINAYVRPGSLSCTSVEGIPLCLLDTYELGDTNDVLGLSKVSSGWSFDARFPTPFGKESIDIRAVDGGGFVVVAVQHDANLTGEPNWSARVWDWDGRQLGCSPRVERKQDLPGWPEVLPDRDALDDNNCLR